ncbi:hypothetical protein VNI00_006273 [Paramarasmius palmivorus]|uniref:Uncharacterized protein n=1 Tax=Paramarasmius palmivorus TaxID=297713 RepID=A0AAW0D9V2_9AGAR
MAGTRMRFPSSCISSRGKLLLHKHHIRRRIVPVIRDQSRYSRTLKRLARRRQRRAAARRNASIPSGQDDGYYADDDQQQSECSCDEPNDSDDLVTEDADLVLDEEEYLDFVDYGDTDVDNSSVSDNSAANCCDPFLCQDDCYMADDEYWSDDSQRSQRSTLSIGMDFDTFCQSTGLPPSPLYIPTYGPVIPLSAYLRRQDEDEERLVAEWLTSGDIHIDTKAPVE